MRLTKQQALEQTLCLWNNIYEELLQYDPTFHPPAMAVKDKIAELSGLGDYRARCPLCEYTYRYAYCRTVCEDCPLYEQWCGSANNNDAPCESYGTPYYRYRIGGVEGALEIALMAEEALDRLKEDEA